MKSKLLLAVVLLLIFFSIYSLFSYYNPPIVLNSVPATEAVSTLQSHGATQISVINITDNGDLKLVFGLSISHNLTSTVYTGANVYIMETEMHSNMPLSDLGFRVSNALISGKNGSFSVNYSVSGNSTMTLIQMEFLPEGAGQSNLQVSITLTVISQFLIYHDIGPTVTKSFNVTAQVN